MFVPASILVTRSLRRDTRGTFDAFDRIPICPINTTVDCSATISLEDGPIDPNK